MNVLRWKILPLTLFIVFLILTTNLMFLSQAPYSSQAKSAFTPQVPHSKGQERQSIFHQNHAKAARHDQKERLDTPSLAYASDTRPPLTVPRLVKYCNLPDTHVQGQEGLVSKDYKLLSVHVVIRHGDRSPIYKLPSADVSDLSCLTDTSQSQFRHIPKVNSYPHAMATASQTPRTGPFNGWSLYPSHTTCSEGQLTGRGAIQLILIGMHLNKRYAHRHHLFTEADWESQVLAHTTETSRTYQSALAFLYGLVPGFNMSKINMQSSTSKHFCEEKVFGAACSCHGLDSVRTRAEGECRKNKDVKGSVQEYHEALNYASDVLGIASSAIPGPVSLMDGLSAHTCHSLPFPCNKQDHCITAKVLESTWKNIDAQSICMAANPSSAKNSRALIHGLLFRIARNFRDSAETENGTNPKFHLYSGHDTTVIPLLVALGLRDNVWPGYAHRVVLELYSTQDRKRNLIRVLQNGKVVTGEVAFCQMFIEGDGMCDLDHFLEYLKERNLPGFCKSLQKGDTDSNFLNF